MISLVCHSFVVKPLFPRILEATGTSLVYPRATKANGVIGITGKRRLFQKFCRFDLFSENSLTIVISKTHLKLRINLSSIMHWIDTGSTLHYSEIYGA